MSAERQPDPIFTVEGRIGGRWWAWQRFPDRDTAALELAQLAAEHRFDGVRMSLTVPGRNGASPLSRSLVVIDGHGVHRPDERPFAAAATAAPARSAPAAEPPAAADRGQRLRVDEILAQLAARSATPGVPATAPPAAAAPASQPHGEHRIARRFDAPAEPAGAPSPALAPPPAAPETIEAAEPNDDLAPADFVDATAERDRAFVRPPSPYARSDDDGRVEPMIDDDPPYLTAEDAMPEEEPSEYLLDPAYEDEPPPRPARRIPRQLVYAVGAGLASLLLAVTSYETTRLLFGMPDLLEEARVTVAGLAAGPERPIIAAARAGRSEEVAKLLKGGFSPNSEDRLGVPAIIVAARAGHTGVVKLLLAAGADPNQSFGYGETPMLIAAREGLLPALELMQAKGGQVNGRGGADLCATPLLLAASAGKLETVNYLLTKGAGFDVLPGCRQGPLDVSARFPRVREALEVAYQRRLASVPAPTRPAAATPAALTVAPPAKPDPAVDPRGYASIMYGLTWRETLAAVKATAKECRDVGRRYVACELKVRPWLDDIETVEAWFDRSDGDRFVSIEARSVELVDYSATRDGAAIRARFEQIRRAIDLRLPPGLKPIVARQAAGSIPFFESLKPDVNAGEFTAFWSDDGRRRPASVHLKLTGIDQRKGYYRLVVSNPQRQAYQQAAAPTD